MERVILTRHRSRTVHDADNLCFKAMQKKAKETCWMRVYLRWLSTLKDRQGELQLSDKQIRRCKYYLFDDLMNGDDDIF